MVLKSRIRITHSKQEHTHTQVWEPYETAQPYSKDITCTDFGITLGEKQETTSVYHNSKRDFAIFSNRKTGGMVMVAIFPHRKVCFTQQDFIEN